MRARYSFVLFLLLFLMPASVNAQAPDPRITSPTDGQVLYGTIAILGTFPDEGVIVAEISFAYSSDPTVWFPIAQILPPVHQGTLAIWDTTRITDGEYDLRLHVQFQDGTSRQAFVRGLRVRNFTPTETPSPVPVPTFTPTETPSPVPVPTFTPTSDLPPTSLPDEIPTRRPTPTPLPPNPLTLSLADIGGVVLRAAWITLLVFLLLFLLFRRRR